jgi:hypothetical protein
VCVQWCSLDEKSVRRGQGIVYNTFFASMEKIVWYVQIGFEEAVRYLVDFCVASRIMYVGLYVVQ